MSASRRAGTRMVRAATTAVVMALLLSACGGSNGNATVAATGNEPAAAANSTDASAGTTAAGNQNAASTAASSAAGGAAGGNTAASAAAPAVKVATSTEAKPAAADKPAAREKGTSAKADKPKGSSAAGTPAEKTKKTASSLADAPCAVKLAPIVVGQVGTFSGLVGQSVGGMKQGLSVWAQDVNEHGGLQCHPVQLYQVDDQNDPQKAAAAAEDLITNKHVQAIVGADVPLTIAGLARTVKKYNIPVIGGDGIDGGWEKDPLFFPQGGNPLSAFGGAPAAIKRALGFQKVALLYCAEAAICTLTASSAKAKGGIIDLAGGRLTHAEQVTLTQPDYSASCQNAKNSGAQFLMVLVDAAAMRRVASSCKNIGFNVPIAGTAIDFTAASPGDKNLSAVGVYASAPVAPFPATDTPAMKAFHAAFGKYLPGQSPDESAIEGWSAGKLFEKSVRAVAAKARAGDLLTSVLFDGLYALSDETVDGLGPGVTFVKGNTPKLKPCYYVLTIKDGSYRAPFGSQKFCFAAEPAEK